MKVKGIWKCSVKCGIMKHMVYRHHFPVSVFMSSASSVKTLHYATLQQMTFFESKVTCLNFIGVNDQNEYIHIDKRIHEIFSMPKHFKYFSSN